MKKVLLFLLLILSFSFSFSSEITQKDLTSRQEKYSAEIEIYNKSRDKFQPVYSYEKHYQSNRRKNKIFTLKNYLTALATLAVIFLGIITYILLTQKRGKK